jgi:DNA-nicking Smr family endonuclease
MKQSGYRRPLRTIPGTTGDILSYLDAHGTRDKDIVVNEPVKSGFHRSVEKRKGGVLRQTFDLHGLTSDEASRSLRAAVESCHDHNIKELLVIHGKGHHSAYGEGPVLKNLVKQMLDNELRLQVKEFRDGLPREGGEGVTVVVLV